MSNSSTSKTNDKKTKSKEGKVTSQSEEAKALLAKMQAKKDAGDCPFC